MPLNIKPLGDRILVEAVEEKEVKKGGIIIPDTAKEKPMESRIVALGTGKTDDSGKKVSFACTRPGRPWKKVLCREAAWRCCGAWQRWIPSSRRTTMSASASI